VTLEEIKNYIIVYKQPLIIGAVVALAIRAIIVR
jgi:hypothetical protein